MPELEGILVEIKELLGYQVKLLEHLVENSGHKKLQDLDKTLEKVTKMIFSKDIKNIIPEEVMSHAIKVAKEMNKEIQK